MALWPHVNMRLRWTLPILKHEAYRRFMKTVNNSLAFCNSDVAQFRFRCLQILERQGYAGVKLAFPSVGRRTVFRWQKKYLKSGRKLSSLIPRTTKPHSVRQMDVPVKILSFIKAMRQQHPNLSKYKVKIFLDEFCQGQGLPCRSDSWIGKVIKRNAFFFNTRKLVKKHRKSNKTKLRVFRCPKQADISLGYLQVDGVRVDWEGQSLWFLCAVELKSRQAYVDRVSSLSSLKAKLFLERIISETSYPIHTIQTDNGSEFAKYFDEALDILSITHKWSRPHSPKVNGYVERFNGVIQKEFIDYHVDLGIIDKSLFDQKLSEWVDWYNTRRPHHGLGLKTPQQRLLQLQQHITNPQSAKCV